MNICGAKFEEHCFHISRDIFIQYFTIPVVNHYDIITFLICIVQKRQYL